MTRDNWWTDGPATTDGLSSGPPDIVIRTGLSGMMAFKRNMEIKNAKDLVDWLLENKKITSEQQASLKSMLESPDEENFTLAIELIKIKQNSGKELN